MVTTCGKNAVGKTVRKAFKNTPEGKRATGKPRKRWLDDAENDLKKKLVRGWRKIAKERDAWELALKEARVLHGPYSRCRQREREREISATELKRAAVGTVSNTSCRVFTSSV